MKESHKAFLSACLVSMFGSIIWLTLFSLGYPASIPGDIEQILITVLRLNGILLGFTVTLFSFLMRRIKSKFTKWAFLFVTTALVSFFFAILFGLIALLNGERAQIIVQLLPISFTLTGILTMIAFVVDVGFDMENVKS